MTELADSTPELGVEPEKPETVEPEKPEKPEKPEQEPVEPAPAPDSVRMPPPRKKVRRAKDQVQPTVAVDHSFFIGLLQTQRDLERNNRLSRYSNMQIT